MPENSSKIPIEEMTEKEFQDFKEKYLDKDKLSLEAINEIKRLFGIGQKGIAQLACDEMHGHSYRCILYHKPQSGVVERLLLELLEYKTVIRESIDKLKKYDDKYNSL